MPNLKKSMILFMVCMCFFMSASCVFADDSIQSENIDLADADDFEIDLDVEDNFDVDTLGETYSDNVTENVAVLFGDFGTDNRVPDTYNDLRDDLENLNDGDVYDIQRDYTITDCDSDLSKNRVINIYSDNVVINGNGHYIDAYGNNGYFAVFKIFGNNVTIVNLNIVNARARNEEYSTSDWNIYGDDYTRVVSPVEWYGDNGVLENCKFNNNMGEDGGAIYWVGNNGLIDNCLFNENFATRGGAIFIGGYDNTISNSVMFNSNSDYADTIFINNFDEGDKTLILNVNNCRFLNLFGQSVDDFHIEGSCLVMSGDEQIYPEITESEPVISDGTYNELRDIIFNLKDGDVLNLTKDYYFEPGSYFYPISANNVTINGNGHRIYGNDIFELALIWVNGNNVNVNNIVFDFNLTGEKFGSSYVEWEGSNGILTNCTFIGNYAQDGGAILWSGTNGLVKDCIFVNNRAENGGAVKWTGSEGVIDDCLFINNTADISGGAIFIEGASNSVNNTLILNSSSSGLGNAIFIDYRRKNLTLANVYFDNPDGAVFDEGIIGTHINTDSIICNEYYIFVGGERYEITSLIYNSIISGGVNYLDDGTYYYSTYYDESGDFVFTIHSVKYAQYDIDYSQSYYFKNIKNNNFTNVFTKLTNNDYETRFTAIETVYVSSAEDYLKALGEFYAPEKIWNIEEDLEWDLANANNMAESYPFTLGMNVIFDSYVPIYRCTIPWDMKLSLFDLLNMDGNGAYITGTFDEDDEYKWVILGEGDVFSATDLTVAGYNTAVENIGGQCVFNRVNFQYNQMDYWFERDWGGAILNTGIVTCINCTFKNNYAKNGGAIFNQGLLVLQDCIFSENEAYGEGNDVCVGDNGKVVVDGVSITENGQCSAVYFAESMSLETATVIATFTVVIGTIVATVVSAVTTNPLIGIAVGLAVGAAMGAGGAGIIIANTYDVNFDRLKCVLTLSIATGVSGALGGMFGGALGDGLLGVFWTGGISAIKWTPILVTFGTICTVPGFVTGITYYCTN